jgi:hypothetical protein
VQAGLILVMSARCKTCDPLAERSDDQMLRLLALLCAIALMLVPMAPAQAQSGCAMLATSGAHAVHGSDHQMPASGHPAQVCKQLCAVVAVLPLPTAVTTKFVTVWPALLRVAQLTELEHPDPSERPPKGLV